MWPAPRTEAKVRPLCSTVHPPTAGAGRAREWAGASAVWLAGWLAGWAACAHAPPWPACSASASAPTLWQLRLLQALPQGTARSGSERCTRQPTLPPTLAGGGGPGAPGLGDWQVQGGDPAPRADDCTGAEAQSALTHAGHRLTRCCAPLPAAPPLRHSLLPPLPPAPTPPPTPGMRQAGPSTAPHTRNDRVHIAAEDQDAKPRAEQVAIHRQHAGEHVPPAASAAGGRGRWARLTRVSRGATRTDHGPAVLAAPLSTPHRPVRPHARLRYWIACVQSCQGPGTAPLVLACSAACTSGRFRYSSVSLSMHGSKREPAGRWGGQQGTELRWGR